jgi:hypothetical protein
MMPDARRTLGSETVAREDASVNDAPNQLDQADNREPTFLQWVAFLVSSPEDDDPAWVQLEKQITDGPPHEQWAIVRAFVKRPISDKARMRLGGAPRRVG